MDVLTLGPLEVPPLAVGAMFWGTRVPGESAHDLLDRAVDRGARFVDTANNYAFWQPGAVGDESETCLGEWIASRGRARIVLATKIGARPARPGAGTDDALGLSRQAIFDQTADSLRRLRTDHVDLLYAHIDDPRVPMAETVGALQEVVERGWARAFAASNLTADRLAEALRATGEGPRHVALQNRFTFLPPAPGTDFGRQVLLDEAVQDACRAHGVAMVGYSTLLEGAYTRADRPLPEAYRQPGSDEALRTLAAVADETGLDAGQAVLSWLAHRPARVIPVIGASRPDQLDSAIAAVTTPMSASAVDALDARSRRLAGERGGGWGIRTPEGLHPTRFPSVRHRPLGESSNAGKHSRVIAAADDGLHSATDSARRPSCELPQGRKAARVNGLWRVRGVPFCARPRFCRCRSVASRTWRWLCTASTARRSSPRWWGRSTSPSR